MGLRGWAWVCLLCLQACAGGGMPTPADGSGMGVSSVESTYPATPTQGLAPAPSNPIPSGYELGQPDKQGPIYVGRYQGGYWKSPTPLNVWGLRVSSDCGDFTGLRCEGPRLGAPVDEVFEAWSQGWTGQGVKAMIEDAIDQEHGVVTALLVSRYAPGASLYGLNVLSSFSTGEVFDNTLGQIPTAYSSTIKLGVVNASYSAGLQELLKSPGPWTQDQLLKARVQFASSAQSVINRYKDVNLHDPGARQLAFFSYADAVITKAAGNDSIKAEFEPLNWFLTQDSAIKDRLLIVGALDHAGSKTNLAELASYSNTAGDDATVQNRFLLASGTSPYDPVKVAINGVPAKMNQGTSFAAPRVAGYVAILRSKFVNLNANQSANILLSTASYETLACFQKPGGCNPAIYGKGEASLSRALAPVGPLK
jgi:hypothetical protein